MIKPLSVSRGGAGGYIFSAVLIVTAGWGLFKGVEFVRFHSIQRTVNSAMASEFSKLPPQSELVSMLESVSSWRDTLGVRAMASSSEHALGLALSQPRAQLMADAAATLRVDPVNADAWLDVAEASWSDPNARALSFAAWDMSAIVAPREWWAIQRRAAFLLAVWPEAPDAQRRQLFFEIDALISNARHFRREWLKMLAGVSVERRQEIEMAFRAYNPSYLQ